ncbi:MAG: methionine--tRNA ligase [Clostridia bacterium]|nr:methionine--tRNA ligase [Clostridia bacterium]
MAEKRYFIGGAWPYANNSLHVGHLAALLPGDIIARYGRLKGYDVIYVSGTDSHGTPITERAKRENVSPASIAEKYHAEFTRDFNDMMFSYDKYTATFTDYHKAGVQEIFRIIEKNGYFYEKTEDQDYCETCGKFVSDREIEGICPVCGKLTRGDQCEFCMASFDSGELKEKRCRTCKNPTSMRENKHLMFALSRFQDRIEEFTEKMAPNWRLNAVNETKKYLAQGLPDRAATRDLTWGVEVPVEGYENKRVYVWFEAVLGYMTAGKWVAEQRGIDFDEYLRDDGKLNNYYIHGKDNIPFHTVIFPALLMAMEKGYCLPTHIVSSEYVNVNDDKMSKSKGNMITVHELAENYPVDAVRFYTILFNPERRDVNFSIPDMISTYNKVLVGGLGNFVNRNLSFIKKKFGGIIQPGTIDPVVEKHVEEQYEVIGAKIEAGELRSAAEDMVNLIGYANKYYDDQKPWIQAKAKDLTDFYNTTATCVYLMANMANIMAPLIPDGAERLSKILPMEGLEWKPVKLPDTFELGEVPILYNRIDDIQ